MTRPKLVAFDLDDTLIGSDGKIAPANFCALEQLSAAGVTAAAVTGRTFYEMPAELRFNPLVPYAVYGDGAAAVNAAGETLFSSCYSREKALAVLHLLRQYDTMIEVFYGGRPYAPADKLDPAAYDYYRIEPIYHPVMAASRVPCTDLETLLAGDEKTEMFNIFFHLDDERRAFIDRATELFPELLCTYSMQSNLEILRRGVDKGSALQKLAEHLGLAPEQVIAVGDSRNDLSMIRYAGTGLAVANACDELKQAANAVACTSDAGVLSYIYHHFVE